MYRSNRLILLVLPLVFSVSAWAAPSAGAAAGSGVVAAEPWGVLLALLAVVGLILALAWLLRRTGFATLGHPAGRVLASLSLGGRERAVLIQIGKEQLLLGVAPGSVRLLVQFEAPIVGKEEASEAFSARLRHWLDAGRRD